VIVRRAEPDDVEGLVACSGALFSEDAGTRDPSIDINWPHEQGQDPEARPPSAGIGSGRCAARQVSPGVGDAEAT
jgi:hypothetical protein